MSRRLERRFVNSDQISRHLFCSICTDIFLDPTRLFCSHTFCKKCIMHWIKDHNTCPICREEIQLPLMGKDLTAEKIIFDLQVSCPNEPCTWIDTLESLQKHYKNCPHSKLPEWVDNVQDYIKIEEEANSNTISWPGSKYLPPLPVDCHFPTLPIFNRFPQDVYCMTFFETWNSRNSQPRGYFESIINLPSQGVRRGSIMGSHSYDIRENMRIPRANQEEETKRNDRGQNEVILIDLELVNDKLFAKPEIKTRHKKSTIAIEDNNSSTIKAPRKVRNTGSIVSDNSDDEFNAEVESRKKNAKRNNRKRVGKLVSIPDAPSEEKLIKKTKTTVM